MYIDNFAFSYQGCQTDTGLVNQVVAHNGPHTFVFDITDTGLKVVAEQTNVKPSHPLTASVALAAARWHRSKNKAAA